MNIFNLITGFFQKNSVKAIVALAVRILKVVLGNAARDLQTIAMEEVLKAEKSGESGIKKYEMAYAGIRDRFKGPVKEYVINLAIEAAVFAYNEAKG